MHNISIHSQIENVVYERLNTLGIDRGLFDEVVTSGGEAKRHFLPGNSQKKYNLMGQSTQLALTAIQT